MLKKNKIPCIVLARKNSRGIKNKNRIKLNGLPLINHTINYLKKVKPEPVYYFASELEVRANWDLNETFDLNIKQSVNDSIN